MGKDFLFIQFTSVRYEIDVMEGKQSGENRPVQPGTIAESYSIGNPLLNFARHISSRESGKALAIDLGATKANLALVGLEGDRIVIHKEEKYHSHDFDGLAPIIKDFLAGEEVPAKAGIGVAGPVLSGRAKMANLGWEIDQKQLEGQLNIGEVSLINDLEATSFGLAVLERGNIQLIHPGDADPAGNIAVIAPGTGLGEAGLYNRSGKYYPFATEGGHCDFAPREQEDYDLYCYLHDKFGHISWERVISGPGIANIYQFLRDSGRADEPAWLRAKLDAGDAPAIISTEAGNCAICGHTMRLFSRYLGFESANMVLKFKATGGLFIGGGIAPQILPLLKGEGFATAFRQMGRLDYLMDKIPVNIIMNPKTALLGAAYYAFGTE